MYLLCKAQELYSISDLKVHKKLRLNVLSCHLMINVQIKWLHEI